MKNNKIAKILATSAVGLISVVGLGATAFAGNSSTTTKPQVPTVTVPDKSAVNADSGVESELEDPNDDPNGPNDQYEGTGDNGASEVESANDDPNGPNDQEEGPDLPGDTK